MAAPAGVTEILDLAEREAQGQVQDNNTNINTGSSRKPRNRININTNRVGNLRLRFRTCLKIIFLPNLKLCPKDIAILYRLQGAIHDLIANKKGVKNRLK